jgi:hypothetical protein
MHDITKVEPLDGYRLRVTFDDGAEGIVDVAKLTGFKGVFASLRDPARFNEVCVHSELGTVYWPNGADLDPDVLYSHATGNPIDIDTPSSLAHKSSS